MTVRPTQAPRRSDRFAAVALFAAALATYFATSSRYLSGGDNAELVTIFARGGVAHPSGYPLYCILLRLCAWMPGGAVLGSSRVTAVLGALSVAALYRACRAWTASPGASLIAAALYAVSPLAWSLSTRAEVFALHALLASLLLWAAAPGAAIEPGRRIVLLAGLAGLALSDHPTIVLLAPVGLLAATRALVASRSRVRAALLGVAAFVAGLLPYLYCLEVGRAPEGRYVWGDPGTWSGLLHHFLRSDFGTLHLTADSPSSPASSNVALFFTQTAAHLLVVVGVIGLVGFGRTFAAASGPGEHAADSSLAGRDVLALLATWVLCGPVLAAFLDVPPEGLGATLVERFRLLPEVVFTIAVAWGLDAWRGLRERHTGALALSAGGVLAIGALCSWPWVRARQSNALELYVENTRKAAPPRAVILGTGDYRLFSFLYTDAVGLRPDVTYVDPHLLGYEWYRRRASRELGADITISGQPLADVVALVDQAFSLDRPVLLTDVFDPRLARAFPTYPLGTLVRVLPRGTPLPPVEGVERENLDVFAGFQRWTPVDKQDAWANAVLPAYSRPWIALARMFERLGDAHEARVNRDRGEEWAGGTADR